MKKPNPPMVKSLSDALSTTGHARPQRTAVLVVNLGTPEAPTASALRRYLREFLGDPRVVEVPRPIWWLILHGIILPFRAPRSAKAYATVWTDEGSPLLVLTRRLGERLQQALSASGADVEVMMAMNYGQPSIDAAVDQLRERNISRLLVLPLYPQYSATTTASVFDRVTRSLSRLRWLPELRFINQYHRNEVWLDAVTDSIRSWRETHGPAEKLLFSFHGIPRRNLMAGDPYHCQCHVSARQITERLGLKPEEWQLSFQSRLGKAEWLKPYTDETLEEMAHSGIKRVQVVCPGFAIDCLETLEEIAEENREAFIEAGGESLEYIPCLNDTEVHAQLLAALCHEHGQGWPGFQGEAPENGASLTDRAARVETIGRELRLK